MKRNMLYEGLLFNYLSTVYLILMAEWLAMLRLKRCIKSFKLS